MTRARMELIAAGMNVALHPNDSVLEQRILYALKTSTATSTGVRTTPSNVAIAKVSGDKNV